jgi:single-strand DNA-binding protein
VPDASGRSSYASPASYATGAGIGPEQGSPLTIVIILGAGHRARPDSRRHHAAVQQRATRAGSDPLSTASTTTIVGNLTRDPEIRYTREGQATTSLGVAVNRRWQNRETNEWEESTSFFDVITWRDLAENVALSLTKGLRVVVTGRLEQRSWETEEGDRRFKVEIVADEVGAALRFATVDVHRIERQRAIDDDADNGPGAGDAKDDPLGAPA